MSGFSYASPDMKERYVNELSKTVSNIESMNESEFRKFIVKRSQANRKLFKKLSKDIDSFTSVDLNEVSKDEVLFALEEELFKIQTAENYVFYGIRKIVYPSLQEEYGHYSEDEVFKVFLVMHVAPPYCIAMFLYYAFDIVTLPFALVASIATGF